MNNDSGNAVRTDIAELRQLILGMRAAYARGENAMEYARREAGAAINSVVATLIAYDLQTGSYIRAVRDNPENHARWCEQITDVLDPVVRGQKSILEVGCGEATTLAGVLQKLSAPPQHVLGFDLSWSRCAAGASWLAGNRVDASLFVADLFHIPLADATIDVVYTSHSIEPNGGREEPAIRELLRVARRAVVLIEPIYELAGAEAQARMRHHGYVRGLKETAEGLGAKVIDYRLLDYVGNPLNPSGVMLIEKDESNDRDVSPAWRCPITYTPLTNMNDVFVSSASGLVYPILRRIPLLRAEHAVVASGILGR